MKEQRAKRLEEYKKRLEEYKEVAKINKRRQKAFIKQCKM
jgi:hypothetical protein